MKPPKMPESCEYVEKAWVYGPNAPHHPHVLAQCPERPVMWLNGEWLCQDHAEETNNA